MDGKRRVEADPSALGDSKRPRVEDEFDFDDSLMMQADYNWRRNPVPALNPATDKIVLQQIDIDYYTTRPKAGMPGYHGGLVAALRIFGVTEKGNSVEAHVHGFTPYFFVQAPAGFRREDCGEFRTALNEKMKSSPDGKKFPDMEFVVNVEVTSKQTVFGYQKEDSTMFLKITVSQPKYVATLRGNMERSITYRGKEINFYPTYESNIPFALRFMVDRDIVGANWIELPAGSYKLRSSHEMTSNCQIEVDIAFDKIISYPMDESWSKLAPLRILSFDIECSGRKGHFPEPEHDPVIQIANYVTVQGESEPIIKNIFTLKSCASIPGAQVMSFDNEKDMLSAWRDLMIQADVDILTGYNIVNFDLPYLINRAKTLNVPNFTYLGRVRDSPSKIKDSTFSSKAYGTHETKDINIEGRVQLDLLQVMQRDYKLSSYSLNSVSAHFLNEQKEDVHYSDISTLQNGNANTRRRLAVYCLKDAYLPQRLLDKLMIMYNYIEMARVTGVPLSYLLTRGQQIKVASQLYRKAGQKNLLVPTMRRSANNEGDKYEGATVIDPIKGFYEQPIATLDFASLYPSIMMAHNLCYTTLCLNKNTEGLSPDMFTRTPSGDVFVKATTKKGLLPQILEELLGARKRAKADLKKATDPLQRAVLDGRQLALKVSANSVYGFTGAQVGQLPCLEISSSVTAFGRQMIDATKAEVEKVYTIANGYSHDAVVVYGDTDSVMVKFGVDTVEEAMKLGEEAAERVSQQFLKPIKLEFEKVYFPYLLMNKKRYAGLYWTKPEKFDKMDCKGIETVRRDNCQLVRDVINTCLRKILVERNVQGAIDYTKNMISDLLCNRLDISLLVITKSISRSAEDYAGKQAHVELAERMKKRDAGSAPGIGDRVAYVIVKGAKGAAAYEKAEDPIYVLENNVPIDANYYLDHQLSQPLIRLFEAILDNPKQQLLAGDHTRKIHVPTPTSGGLMKFAVKAVSCIGCKASLSPADQKVDKTLCHHCRPNEREIYAKQLAIVNRHEQLFSRAWTQCQRCQGSLHQDVLCSSRDCPIFYARKKVQKDLKEAQELLDRFQVTW